jgi:MFS family permease
MKTRVAAVGLLLFLSGGAALVYQITWQRELRAVFGGSTAATGAVLAIFMGGLGLGNAWLAPRVDRQANPLAFYARLEALVALSAAASPLAIGLVRSVYLALGGQTALGLAAATVIRLALSALVLGLPTVLMGATLPAAARAVTTADDASRRRLGMLYGLNTLGSVAGAAASTFYLLEALGMRRTLWLACGVNVLVAAAAGWLARPARPGAKPGTVPRFAEPKSDGSLSQCTETGDGPSARCDSAVAPWCVYLAAAVAGFAFFLMELVWYRMLGPLLGGTTFTFGLILAVALLGIAVGGGLYSLLFRCRPTRAAFALTCALEALLLSVPYSMGDRPSITWPRSARRSIATSSSRPRCGGCTTTAAKSCSPPRGPTT